MYRSNADDRKDIIERIGEEEFVSCGMFPDLQEPSVPPCFLYLFRIFLEVYREDLSWQEIESYCNLHSVRLSLYELDVLMKMRGWAGRQIKEMRESEE